MSEETFDDTLNKSSLQHSGGWELSDFSDCQSFQMSYPLFEQFKLESQIPISEPENKKFKPKRKKRSKKYDRANPNEAKDDQRAVKKYAKFDTMNQVFQKYTEKKGILWSRLQDLAKQHKVCKRSLRYMFLSLGILKVEKQLGRYYEYFKKFIQESMETKYSHRSQIFKQSLLSAISDNESAINYLLEGNDMMGIKVAYTGNKKGDKGRTKNPTQMEKCQRLYQNIFSIHLRSNQHDLDMLLF